MGFKRTLCDDPLERFWKPAAQCLPKCAKYERHATKDPWACYMPKKRGPPKPTKAKKPMSALTPWQKHVRKTAAKMKKQGLPFSLKDASATYVPPLK